MLRRALVAFAGAMALMGGAFAAEPLPPPPPLPPPFSWDGFYIGVTAGYAQATPNINDLNGFNELPESGVGGSQQFRSSGFIGGGTLGYNWQAGGLVYGLETDFSGLTNSNDISLSIPGACIPGTFQFTNPSSTCGYGWQYSNRISWLWTVRPRIGVAADRTLIYFTGGFALAGVQNGFWSTGSCGPAGCNGLEPFFAVSNSSARIGFAVGGGVEYALTPNWTIKGEALYVDLQSSNAAFSPILVGEPGHPVILLDGSPFNIRWDNSLVVIRAGLNYKFNWAPVPIVAKY